MSQILGHCKLVDKLGKYLGGIIDGCPRRKEISTIVCSNLEKNLQGRKFKLLSKTARITLIQSTLSQIPLYHLHYYCLTKGEANRCDSIMANFLWQQSLDSKSPAMIAWKRICKI